MLIDSFEAVNENCDESYDKKKNSISVPRTWTDTWRSLIWHRFLAAVFMNVIFFGVLFMCIFKIYFDPFKPLTTAWMFIVGYGTSFGTTAGAHRLWTHRSYKAKLPLRILLMLLFSAMGLYSIYDWVRDHRVHHKYSETDADPHNAKRGFLFSHVGWLCMRRHPECYRRRHEVDLSDIEADGVVMFQKKYVTLLVISLCFVLPSLVPILLWEESVLNAVLSQCVIRYGCSVHCVFSVNSIAHLYGNRPYNRFINPKENLLVCFLTHGEGSHNYHHTFPWDYKTSELPYLKFNLTTLYIRTMAKIGWAYDLREPSFEQVQKVIERVGYKSKIEDHDF